jgi:oligoendopeptidase F
MQSRSEVAKKDTWNLEPLYASVEEWKKDFTELSLLAEKDWQEIANLKKEFTPDVAYIKKLIEAHFSISRKIDKLFTYVRLWLDQDITNTEAKNAYMLALAVAQGYQEAVSWIEPKILATSESFLKKCLDSDLLKEYRVFIHRLIDQKAYVLSEESEKLMSYASRLDRAPNEAFKALNNADLVFGSVQDSEGKKHPLTHGLYQVYMKSFDRTLRENTYRTLHNAFRGFENTIGELLSGELQTHLFQKKARSYPSCLEASLIGNQIPKSVYMNLLSTVEKNTSALHAYTSLRKEALDLDELHYWDMGVPLIQDVEWKFTFEEACEIVIASVAPLGKEYQEILRKGLLEDRWVDVYENKGKRSGAYSGGSYDSMPYILLNFHGTLQDLMTLSHEAGHSMHTYLSNKNQKWHEARYPIFLAEIASTVHEQLTADYLLQKTEDVDKRLYLLQTQVDGIRNTFFRQTLFAAFEYKIHELVEEEEPLTPLVLKTLYGELNEKYYGPSLIIDEELKSEYLRIPHFYYNFYVYQYATGIAAAIFSAEKLYQGDREAYLQLLKSGASDYPMALLKRAGIDLESTAIIENCIETFSQLVRKFEKELSKIRTSR